MGFESPARDYAEPRIELQDYVVTNPASTFFMRVETDAMVEAHIPVQSIVVIDRSLPVRNGSIIVAVVDGEKCIRQYVENSNGKYLVPANYRYKPMEIKEELMVWGVVAFVIVDVRG